MDVVVVMMMMGNLEDNDYDNDYDNDNDNDD